MKLLAKLSLVAMSIGVAVGCSEPNVSVDKVMASLEKSTSKKLDNGVKRLPFKKTEDGQGIVFGLQMPGDIFSENKDVVIEGLKTNMGSLAENIFCNNIGKNNQMGQYFAANHYFVISVGDTKTKEAFNLKIDTKTCADLKAQKAADNKAGKIDVGALMVKQQKQGYYDDEFIKEVFVKQEQKNLPVELDEGLEIYKVSAAGNREVNYHIHNVESKMNFADYQKIAREDAFDVVKPSMAESYCEDPYGKELLRNVKAINVLFDKVPEGNFSFSIKDCK